MRIDLKVALMSVVLSLSACAGPMTQYHSANQSEIGAEAQEQLALSKGGTLKQMGDAPNTSGSSPSVRLDTISDRILTSAAPYCGSQVTGSPLRCAYDVVLEKSDEINAYADGKSLHVNEGLITRMPSDDALAFVIAHELAHNTMSHVTKGQSNVMLGALLGTGADLLASSQGYETGGKLSQLGQQRGMMAYSQDFEKEADYMGVYFMGASGYDLNGALTSMRTLASHNPEGINAYGQTHPSTAERGALLSKTIAEVKAKQSAGQALTPQMRPKK